MSKHYEELSGAEGRARVYRPLRISAQQHFFGHAPKLHFDDQDYALADLSIAGFGGHAAGELNEAPDDAARRRGVLRLTQRGRELFAAPALRARLELSKGRWIAGFALEEGVLDLDALRRANAAALAAAAPKSDAAVPDAYKALSAEAMHFIGSYLSRIDRFAGRVEATMSPAERRAVASDLASECENAWRALMMQGNALVAPWHDDKPLREALKAFTETTLTRLLCGGETWRRSFEKPQGYPGDFRIMNFMYDGTPRGETIASMFLHLTGVIAGQPIVSRMRRLADLIVERGGDIAARGAPVNIMSVGAGPARELERIAALSPPGARWRATLVDQEAEALEYAVANVRARRLGVEVTPLNVSFKEMLVPSALGAHFAGQDVIYSSGLVDYLSPMAAQRFVRRMYDFLRPGGLVIIGNVNNLSTGTIWPMEHILDWTLYFRSEAEMRAMATGFDPAQVAIVEDEMRAIYFLAVRKPA